MASSNRTPHVKTKSRMELIDENYKLRMENDRLRQKDYRREKSLLKKAKQIRELKRKLNGKKGK